MKKKLTALFLALVMCMTMSAPALADTSVREDTVSVELVTPPPLDSTVQLILEREKPAADAYSELLSHIEKLENGHYTYPDTYAGAYMNDTYKLCVSLTDCSDEVIAQYMDYFTDPSVVSFEKATYSYNYLSDIMYSVAKTADNISCIYVDEKANVVKVGTPEEIHNTKNASSLSSNLPIEWFIEEMEYPAGPITGGDGLVGYTIGACGTYQGSDAIVLCGHGLDINDSLTLQNSNKVIATVVLQKCMSDNLYDYAVATINSGAGVTLTNRVYNNSSYTTITSESSSRPLVGTTICKYGKITGFGTAEVTSNNTSWSSTAYGNVYGMVRCEMIGSSETKQGDSGGPVYVGHAFHGTISTTSTSGSFYFSPIGGVPGFTVKTS